MVLEGQDLSFGYPGSAKSVFRDINLLTSKDELVATVGPRGTGKSALAASPGRVLFHQPVGKKSFWMGLR